MDRSKKRQGSEVINFEKSRSIGEFVSSGQSFVRLTDFVLSTNTILIPPKKYIF
ncbi:hypothetical protein GGP77_003108 [Salinibacter ruber]|nr:hypothetical protein [Salinibacter ruber]